MIIVRYYDEKDKSIFGNLRPVGQVHVEWRFCTCLYATLAMPCFRRFYTDKNNKGTTASNPNTHILQ